ncbi:MAG: ABC transporter permease [Bacteroidetes bacterium]|nr:ABC transporter permease [Bacteroidota bacterium]
MLIKLAWRNIWRNKKRSMITIASILFAVLLSNLMQSIQNGTWDLALNTTTSLTGAIQVQNPEYWDEPILDNGLDVSTQLVDKISENRNVDRVTSRIQTGALAAHGKLSKFVMITALDPEVEESILEMGDKLHAGRLLSATDNSIIVGRGLANYFDIGIGDTLTMLGQGFYGQSANANFVISGIIRFGTDETSSGLVIMPIELGKEHFGGGEMMTSLNVYLKNIEKLDHTKKRLDNATSEDEVQLMTWREMMPELYQAFQADTGGAVIMLLVLYLIIGFGIFGTILMMTTERMYEYGVMVSVGMKRIRLIIVMILETVMLAIIGILVGTGLSVPLMYLMETNPIPLTGGMAETLIEYGFEPVMVGIMSTSILWSNVKVLVIIIAVVIIYPAIVISKLKPVKAMRK